jgi:hypothetical protein
LTAAGLCCSEYPPQEIADMKPSQIHHAFEQATAHFSAELAVAARHIYRSARQKAEADWGETPEADDALGATRRYLFEQFVAELGLQSGHRVSKVKFPKTTRTYRALTVEGFEISVHRNSSYFGMPASNLRGFQGVFNHGLLDLFAKTRREWPRKTQLRLTLPEQSIAIFSMGLWRTTHSNWVHWSLTFRGRTDFSFAIQLIY